MIDSWTAAWLPIFDALLGWMLLLPRDLAVILLATATVVLITIVRWRMIDRDFMRLIRDDRRDLRRLIRMARVAGDAADLARYKRIRTKVAQLQLRQELPVMLLVALPLAGLLTWAAHRLHFERPPEQGPLHLVVWLPASSIGDLVHLVPQEGIIAEDGWIRQASKATRDSVTRGRADWRLFGSGLEDRVSVTLRYGDETIQREVSDEQLARGDLWRHHAADVETEVLLNEYLPFSTPSFARLGLPPWSVLYSLVVILGMGVLSLVAATLRAGSRTLKAE